MKVQFPFGHGLSYTTFEYSDLKLSSKNILDTDKLEVSVKITNTGKVSGKEIVQLYVSELTGTHEDRPVKELKAFTKVQLNPKESKVVTMTLDKRSFAFWNTEIGDWYAPTGEYLISAGASCTDIRLTAKVNVTSTAKGVFKINENTVLEEMLEHPVAAKCAEPLVKSFMDEMLGDRSESEKESVSDEMMLAMLRLMPLRALRSFINMKDEEVVKFIEETNKELSK